MDGTNASDDAGDRPGMRALKEMKVLSPLRLSGITKTALREYSRNAGLFTWNKPAYACLATRVPSGISIEASVLKDVEWAEKSLSDLGFRDFRVRVYPDPASGDTKPDAPWCAKLQLTEDMIPKLMEQRKEICALLKQRFTDVTLDLVARTPSM